MSVLVFCCGGECGVATSSAGHAAKNGSGTLSWDTTTFRSGLRSIRFVSAANNVYIEASATGLNVRTVGRFYVRFATLPNADCIIAGISSADGPAVTFKVSDSKLYASIGTNFGASGVSVTTGIWYRVDFNFLIQSGGSPDLSDAQIDGVAVGQASFDNAGLTSAATIAFGIRNTCTADLYIDDIAVSNTAADYPLGAGHVISSIPDADGTHNVAGANDFERTLTGTDITNGTTTAWQLVADRPLPTTAVDFINGIAPPNSTDYVELDYAAFTGETLAPNGVECIFVHHDASGAGTNSFTITLRHNTGATSANVFSGTTNVGATITYKRAHFATIPGGAAWTLAAANDLRTRFLVADASPDPYIDALMLEADFPERSMPPMFHRPRYAWNRRVL